MSEDSLNRPWRLDEEEPYEMFVLDCKGHKLMRVFLDDAPVHDYNAAQRAKAKAMIEHVNSSEVVDISSTAMLAMVDVEKLPAASWENHLPGLEKLEEVVIVGRFDDAAASHIQGLDLEPGDRLVFTVEGKDGPGASYVGAARVEKKAQRVDVQADLKDDTGALTDRAAEEFCGVLASGGIVDEGDEDYGNVKHDLENAMRLYGDERVRRATAYCGEMYTRVVGEKSVSQRVWNELAVLVGCTSITGDAELGQVAYLKELVARNRRVFTRISELMDGKSASEEHYAMEEAVRLALGELEVR